MKGQNEGLVLHQVSVSIEGKPLFNPISLQVRPGAILSLMGSSGAGKSTLLAAITGTMDRVFIVHGAISLNGVNIQSVAPAKRRIGILFQDDLLFPHMTVEDNLLFAVPHGVSAVQKRQRIDHALNQIEMYSMRKRKPFAISGGQRLRVALARTLLAEPQAVLLDEPFSKLDQSLRHRTRLWVFAYIRQYAIPTLMVTHDKADAVAVGDGNIYTLQPLNNASSE